jgi:hypothetical protein
LIHRNDQGERIVPSAIAAGNGAIATEKRSRGLMVEVVFVTR